MLRYFSPKENEKQFISNDILISFNNDFYKIVAKNDIKKGTIVIKEIPSYHLFGEVNYDRMLQFLHVMITANDSKIDTLYPRNDIELLDKNSPYNINLIKCIKEANYNKFDKIKDDLLLSEKLNEYYYKYLFNAFEMYNSPVLLFIGAMMNHSCQPNVKFYEKNNAMYFEASTDIKKGDELTYSYLRNSKTKTNKDNKKYLIQHYNFECQCKLCIKVLDDSMR